MMPSDYYAFVDGYNIKQRQETDKFRTHAFITIMPHLKTGYTFERFCNEVWQMNGDEKKEATKIDIDDDQMQAIFKAHNLPYPQKEIDE